MDESRGGGERRGLARGKARIEDGKERREEARFFRSMSRCPNAVWGERGGDLRTREAVSWGIPWMNPRERARVKVEIEGEPKAR